MKTDTTDFSTSDAVILANALVAIGEISYQKIAEGDFKTVQVLFNKIPHIQKRFNEIVNSGEFLN